MTRVEGNEELHDIKNNIMVTKHFKVIILKINKNIITTGLFYLRQLDYYYCTNASKPDLYNCDLSGTHYLVGRLTFLKHSLFSVY